MSVEEPSKQQLSLSSVIANNLIAPHQAEVRLFRWYAERISTYGNDMYGILANNYAAWKSAIWYQHPATDASLAWRISDDYEASRERLLGPTKSFTMSS